MSRQTLEARVRELTEAIDEANAFVKEGEGGCRSCVVHGRGKQSHSCWRKNLLGGQVPKELKRRKAAAAAAATELHGARKELE
eukprot:6674969-Prymnesium_polylepis.1